MGMLHTSYGRKRDVAHMLHTQTGTSSTTTEQNRTEQACTVFAQQQLLHALIDACSLSAPVMGSIKRSKKEEEENMHA